MRHKKTCHIHKGRIATCVKCSKSFTINDIVENALNVHLGNDKNEFQFPEKKCQPLDRIVYEMGKDFSWMERNAYDQSVRYFAGNAITNVHLTTHSKRCFKKGAECYTNLPDGISESNTVVYNTEKDSWSN